MVVKDWTNFKIKSSSRLIKLLGYKKTIVFYRQLYVKSIGITKSSYPNFFDIGDIIISGIIITVNLETYSCYE